jgi:glycosyltransferase involved in cell wall biosynthesis
MREHIARLSRTYDVSVACSIGTGEDLAAWLPGVQVFPVAISRQIDPIADARSLLALMHLFRRESFDVVHSITPKAGLLAMMAARLNGVPHRIHCFTGQVWATRSGMSRRILKFADRVTAANANHVICDSHSQREFLLGEQVTARVDVLANGSISGVDVERFKPDADRRSEVRGRLGIPSDACTLLFVGRLNVDKGIRDLAQAFIRLARGHTNVWLLIVGPDEAGMATEVEAILEPARDRTRRIDYTSTPEHYMAAADVFCLPSYREGFGSVVIEAAACGIPSVASRIYGLTDAVLDGRTGLLHAPGDIGDLTSCLERLLSDPALRRRFGTAALQRAREKFAHPIVVEALAAYYQRILAAHDA